MSESSSLPSRPVTPVNLQPPDQLPTARPYRFTWDPSSRRPGPESVSGTTEGRGGDDFGGGAHPLGFLNTSATSLALGSLPTEWSSSRTGFHAISTMLNNPHKRQAPPKAHSSLPTVPPADLPRVRRKDFESYLRSIGPEWERYEHNTRLEQEGPAQIDDSQWTPRNSISGEDPQTPQPASQLVNSQGKAIPPLDSVPSVFFEKDFHLGEPRTFAAVTELDAAAALSTPRDDSFSDPFSLSHSLPLLEKFSHYADTVEQHLVREISIRSTSFFAALTNLHDLQSESEQCLDRIGRLRTQLKNVDENSAKRGLEMVRKESKMANLGKVRDGVKMISGIVEMSGVAKSLVHAGQWGEALGVIEDLERLWEASEPPPPDSATSTLDMKPTLQNGNGTDLSSLSPTPEEQAEDEQFETAEGQEFTKHESSRQPVPLSSLHAFSALPSHLRVLTMEIAASLSLEFVSVLRNDLELRITGDGKPRSSDTDQGLKDRLKPLLVNLVRTKGLKEGMLSWREAALLEVGGIIKKIIPSFEPDGEEGSGSQYEAKPGLANHLRSMHHPEFVVLIQQIYRSLFNGLEGLKAQSTVIVDVLGAIGSQARRKVTNIPAVEEDLTDIISSSAELASIQAAKVISFRAEQHAVLELAEFLTFFNDSWAFVIKCEKLSRRMIIGLRGTVASQAKQFLQAFHQIRLTRSAKLVEDELWNQTEVTAALQHSTNVIVDSAVRDPPELVITSDEAIFSPYATTTFPTSETNGTTRVAGQSPSNAGPSTNGASSATGSGTKHLRIEDRSYYVVLATSEMLTLVLDYLRIVINLPTLTTDTMNRVIEFLKAFNSRTCQVVLGAGAMRSAGLKNITAKHLALASQSLSIVFELIPYVRETFRRHLKQQEAGLLVEFDKLKRDYQEHQNEIHSKLVAIMGDRLNAHIKSLKAVDWSVPKPSGGVNDYMEILIKETVTLHKVLSRYLAPPVVEYVMTQVFAAINHRLSEEYNAIELPHQEAKNRLLADARYLHQKLAALKNVGTPTGMLETVVAEKPLPRPGGLSSDNVANGSSPNTPAKASAPVNVPTRSNTLSTNARLKGLMSGTRTSFLSSGSSGQSQLSNTDKALPLPARTPSPPPVPPPSDKPRSPVPPPQTLGVNNIYGLGASQDQLASGSQLSLSMTTSQNPETGGGPGFRRVSTDSGPNNPK
ncbi:unnamed protein product [Cyclocybe aegerita]|uniref:Vacuolar protein sorting-associated protein 54 C-terminal domain-containing protein n=1 Tax=Cyclocybe aegerita TaxID=1973307 RepID=A0A8S0XU14_CYCAE|nr:unnamed protein product [Cyclocybe aegerita]